MKDGWTIAMGEYLGITIYFQHLNILDCYSESIICPFIDPSFPIVQSLINLAGPSSISEIKAMRVLPGKAQDVSSGSLLQSRLILCAIPSHTDNNLILQAFSMGLHIANSLGCSSSSIPLVDFGTSLQSSAEVLIESFENYALNCIERNNCIKEIFICTNSQNGAVALMNATKFRMTRYSSFISFGLPSEEMVIGGSYCYECCKIILLSNKCEHFKGN